MNDLLTLSDGFQIEVECFVIHRGLTIKPTKEQSKLANLAEMKLRREKNYSFENLQIELDKIYGIG